MPFFIALVGPSFTGKTSLTNALTQYFIKKGKKVRVCRAYSKSDKKMFEKWLEHVTPLARTLFFASLFAEQRAKVEVAMAKGVDLIIAERWIIDALVATSSGDIAQMPIRNHLIDAVFAGIKPNLCFLLQVPPHVVRGRYDSREKSERTAGDEQEIGRIGPLAQRYEEIGKAQGAISISSESSVQATAGKMIEIIEKHL